MAGDPPLDGPVPPLEAPPLEDPAVFERPPELVSPATFWPPTPVTPPLALAPPLEGDGLEAPPFAGVPPELAPPVGETAAPEPPMSEPFCPCPPDPEADAPPFELEHPNGIDRVTRAINHWNFPSERQCSCTPDDSSHLATTPGDLGHLLGFAALPVLTY
jgi:hypothetical protein